MTKGPHPNPLPEYRAREQSGDRYKSALQPFWFCDLFCFSKHGQAARATI